MKRINPAVAVAVAVAASTVALSMVLNAWAFTKETGHPLGYALGVLVPCWILALTYMGHRAWAFDRRLAAAAFGLAGFALLVSLPHLAHGYEWLGLAQYEAWSLAVVTDLAQVVAKLLVIGLVHPPVVLQERDTSAQGAGSTKRAKRKTAVEA